jgi:hypothetical protein
VSASSLVSALVSMNAWKNEMRVGGRNLPFFSYRHLSALFTACCLPSVLCNTVLSDVMHS